MSRCAGKLGAKPRLGKKRAQPSPSYRSRRFHLRFMPSSIAISSAKPPFPRMQKSPGRSPGFATERRPHARETGLIQSGDLLEGAGDAFLDRLDGLGRDLLGQRSELLALRAEGVELLAHMRG